MQLRLQWCDQILRQHRHPVFVALALAHHDFAAGKLHILHAQAQRLQQAHAGTVQQLRHQAGGAIHVQQQFAHLGGREHHRQALGRLCLHHLVEPGQIDFQNLLVQVQKCRLGLILRGGGHIALHRQMAQKRLHLRHAHITRVALAMKQHKAARPIDIRLLGANAVMPRAQVNAHALEQLGRARRGGAAGGLRGLSGVPGHPRNFRFA